jgi:hypothetical protein
MTFNFDPDKYSQPKPYFVAIQIGLIAANHPGFLQHPHPSQTGRGGQADFFRQLHIAQSTVPLQGSEDFTVVGIQFHGLADPDGVIIFSWQIMPIFTILEADYATTCPALAT